MNHDLERALVDGNISWTAEEIRERVAKAGYDIVPAAPLRGQYQEDLEKIHGAPIGWFPTKGDNPSKLQAHKFADGEWIPLSYFKLVSWPEKYGRAA